MTAPNLTRADARLRAALLRVDGYDIWLDLTDGHGGPGEGTFGSRTVVTFASRRAGADTVIDVRPHGPVEASLNGRALDTGAVSERGVLPLPGLLEHNRLEVTGCFPFTDRYEGLQRTVDPADGAVYVQSTTFMAAAQRIFACFDQPDLKAVFTFHVTAPAGWTVVSNGAVAGREHSPSGAETYHFSPTPALPTYITAVFAGPYHRVVDAVDGPDGPIRLGLYCVASAADLLDVERMWSLTKRGFDLFHDRFDYPYPFGKYDQLFGAEPGFGGMENAGVVGLGGDFLFRSRVSDSVQQDLANVVLHELAHMWFGNLVTTRWWDDTWLNEAFATYAAYYAQVAVTDWGDSWARFAQEEKTWALAADQLPTTHPIAADVVDLHTALSNFDSITYAKGASVLRQLVAYVGEEAFFSALQAYFREHRFGNAELADLLRALESSSGRELGSWSDQWLTTSSVNVLRPSFEVTADGSFASFAVEQDALPGYPTLRTHRLAIGLYRDLGGWLDRVLRVEVDVSGARTEVPELVGQPAPQVVVVNDDDLTYAKLRFDPASLEVLRTDIGRIRDPLTRSLCWTALWDMTRDGELPATGYVDLVLRAITAETSPSLVSGLLDNAGLAVRDYVRPDRLSGSRERLAEAAWAGMHTAPHAGDSQLLWSRCFARVAGFTTGAGRLRQLYDGELAVAGVDLDFETRWSLLQGLVPHGLADQADIAAELEREPSSTAEERAAKAGAAIPSADVKRRIWDEITSSGGMPQPIRTAKAEGFWTEGQDSLLQGFVARYFDSLQRFWDLDGGGHQSVMLTRELFPRIVHESTLAAADAWLAPTTDRPTQRRTVLERRDELSRALRNRAADR